MKHDAAEAAGAAGAAGGFQNLPLRLDWSAFDAYGQGDAYAAVPTHGAGFGKAASLCIGSRQCQKAVGQAGEKGVMCPSFRVTQDDLHSTRGRAALLRDALNGELGPRPFIDGALDAAMDLCVACKGCKRECPNGVDMAALRAETLAQRWTARRPPLRTRLVADLPRLLPRLPLLRALWNAALSLRRRMPGAAALMERTTGIAAARPLPPLAARSFMDGADAASAAAGTPAPSDTMSVEGRREVVLLVDCFANHFDPGIAQATRALLTRAGYRVHLLGGSGEDGAPLCCGRTAFSSGLIDTARERAHGLLAVLMPHVAAGRVVIGLEPSCLTMLRDEFAMLGLPAAQVQALTKSALMLEEFLAREIDGKRWRPAPAAQPAKVLVHGHCHQKAYGTLKAMRKVLGAVTGLEVEWIESSCCGMAGAFGIEAEHHAMSLRMAELSLLPAVRAAAPQDLILASGTSCRQQIQDGAARRSLHLAEVLMRVAAPEAAA